MFKKIISFALAVATVAALAVPAGATYTSDEYIGSSLLTYSYAGYKFSVKNFYDYMWQYNGKKFTNTYYDWYSDNKRAGKIFTGADWSACSNYEATVYTWKCNYDAYGTLHVSRSGSEAYCNGWEGISITADGYVNYTWSYSSDYDTFVLNAAYNPNSDKWTCSWNEGGIGYHDSGTYTNKEFMEYWNSEVRMFTGEALRICNWQSVPYICYQY